MEQHDPNAEGLRIGIESDHPTCAGGWTEDLRGRISRHREASETTRRESRGCFCREGSSTGARQCHDDADERHRSRSSCESRFELALLAQVPSVTTMRNFLSALGGLNLEPGGGRLQAGAVIKERAARNGPSDLRLVRGGRPAAACRVEPATPSGGVPFTPARGEPTRTVYPGWPALRSRRF